MRSLLISLAMLFFIAAPAQSHMSEAAAKEAVYRIVRHSGLLPNFIVREDLQVRTAVAYIKGKERLIAYNPVFISTILDSSGTDWSAVSVLAHEIAHHLLGHTLDPEAVRPGDELACDRYPVSSSNAWALPSRTHVPPWRWLVMCTARIGIHRGTLDLRPLRKGGRKGMR